MHSPPYLTALAVIFANLAFANAVDTSSDGALNSALNSLYSVASTATAPNVFTGEGQGPTQSMVWHTTSTGTVPTIPTASEPAVTASSPSTSASKNAASGLLVTGLLSGTRTTPYLTALAVIFANLAFAHAAPATDPAVESALNSLYSVASTATAPVIFTGGNSSQGQGWTKTFTGNTTSIGPVATSTNSALDSALKSLYSVASTATSPIIFSGLSAQPTTSIQGPHANGAPPVVTEVVVKTNYFTHPIYSRTTRTVPYPHPTEAVTAATPSPTAGGIKERWVTTSLILQPSTSPPTFHLSKTH